MLQVKYKNKVQTNPQQIYISENIPNHNNSPPKKSTMSRTSFKLAVIAKTKFNLEVNKVNVSWDSLR